MTLASIWKQQQKYNDRIKERQNRSSAEWMEVYILGLMSECGQLLEAMRWKKNRLQTVEEFGPNVPEELADITKFVLSMWQQIGFTPEQMIERVHRKGLLLDSLFTQEFETQLKPDVVVFDVDNVLADTQAALAQFFDLEHFDVSKLRSSIHLDLAANQPFDEYRRLKNKFELEGGYLKLDPIYPIRFLFKELRNRDISIVCYTARPVDVFKRIRQDTFEWFLEFGVKPDIVRFGREERISWIANLIRSGHRVVLMDDDPGIAVRAELNNVPVIVPYQEYNSKHSNFNGTVHDLIQVLEGMLYEQRSKSNGNP